MMVRVLDVHKTSPDVATATAQLIHNVTVDVPQYRDIFGASRGMTVLEEALRSQLNCPEAVEHLCHAIVTVAQSS